MTDNEWKMRGKENSPGETVKKIETILKENDFGYVYEDNWSGISDCYSSKLSLTYPDGDFLVTNGKGMSRQLCRASAFAEMMERMSNAVLYNLHPHDPYNKEIRKGQGHYYSVYDEDQPECILRLKRSVLDSMKDPGFCSKELLLDAALARICSNGGVVPSYPFYSVRKKQVEYLPIQLLQQFTESTGMAAGNTIPEAVVEGASEIFERYVQARVIEGGVRLTRLPESVIAEYPHIVSMIREIEKDGDKTMILMDASIGMRLPVICGVCISHNTGRIGVRFGAHPMMSVAIERIFTEGTQVRTLEMFSKMNSINFKRDYTGKRIENWENLKRGVGRMPAEIVDPKPSSEYIPWEDYSKESNTELMWKMIDLMETLGADVYIRDTSIMGFPAVYIYAAGISETHQADWVTVSYRDSIIRSQYILTHLETAEERDIRSLSFIAGLNPGNNINKDYSYLMSVPMKKRMPGGVYQGLFLKGMCKYCLGEIEEADDIIQGTLKEMGSETDNGLERAIGAYLSGLRSGFDKADIATVLQKLYPDYYEKTIDIMSDPGKALVKLYPVCNGFDCEHCKERGICKQPELREVNKAIWAKLDSYQPTEDEICNVFSKKSLQQNTDQRLCNTKN